MTQHTASSVFLLQPSSSPLPSPPPPLGAGSLEASPPLWPQPTLVEDLPDDNELTSDVGPMVGLKGQTPLCHVTSEINGGQSQSLFQLAAVATEPTKDEHQLHTEPSQEEEELHETVQQSDDQPITEDQEEQSDVEQEPVSPVLDMDPSLDQEVMELMTSSPPPSLLHLSSPTSLAPPRRGKGRSLRPPPCSPRLCDDLAIRLRQSPFSTEASPETSPARAPVTPPPLTPPSPSLRTSPSVRESPLLSKVSCSSGSLLLLRHLSSSSPLPLFCMQPQAPPTTILPFTPKIGMGKPAISKRRFSPGRARVKQVSDLLTSEVCVWFLFTCQS